MDNGTKSAFPFQPLPDYTGDTFCSPLFAVYTATDAQHLNWEQTDVFKKHYQRHIIHNTYRTHQNNTGSR